jgi:hypothetical protein
MFKKTVIAATTMATLFAGQAFAETSKDELLKILEAQQKQIEELKDQVEATADAVEDVSSSSFSNTSIGGYGELHYNKIEDKKSIDFHRFVLFLGHEFSDDLRFFSELEVEHSLAGDGKPGEVELEQAYIEQDLSDTLSWKGGLFLVPVGIINETHEPNTFYGVERNPVEKNIIPATWWEAGAAFNIKMGEGLQFDAALTSGLEVDPTTYNLRSGRQKVAKANADSLAFTGRVKWTGMAGLEVAATIQKQQDITQGIDDASATLFETHVDYRTGGFGLRALYAGWNVSGANAKALNKDKQDGFYLEPSFRFNESIGVFGRYSKWDNGSTTATDSAKTQINVGVNYWLHENVAIKFDIENRGGAQDGSGFNLGIGYQF